MLPTYALVEGERRREAEERDKGEKERSYVRVRRGKYTYPGYISRARDLSLHVNIHVFSSATKSLTAAAHSPYFPEAD